MENKKEIKREQIKILKDMNADLIHVYNRTKFMIEHNKISISDAELLSLNSVKNLLDSTERCIKMINTLPEDNDKMYIRLVDIVLDSFRTMNTTLFNISISINLNKGD